MYVKAGELRKAMNIYEKNGAENIDLATEFSHEGKKELAEQHYNMAYKAYREAGRLKRILSGQIKPMSKPSKLETAAATTAIVGVLAGIFFLSPNATGNVIGILNKTSSNWIGGVLFLIGLVGAFAYFKRKWLPESLKTLILRDIYGNGKNTQRWVWKVENAGKRRHGFIKTAGQKRKRYQRRPSNKG